MAGKNYKQLLDSSSFLSPHTATVISSRFCAMTIHNNVGGTGERREECIPFFKVHILSNVLYNLKNPHESTVDG